jgi:hypothetical protein
MEQLLCHILGDFALQSDWCALNKSKKSLPCLVHVLIYTSCFLLLTVSWKALLVIGITHFILDRWHVIIRRLIWWKNHFPLFRYPPYHHCDTTGYYDDSPYNSSEKDEYREINGTKWNTCVGRKIPNWWGKPRLFFVTIWLYIITDNFFHLFINYMAIKYLG